MLVLKEAEEGALLWCGCIVSCAKERSDSELFAFKRATILANSGFQRQISGNNQLTEALLHAAQAGNDEISTSGDESMDE